MARQLLSLLPFVRLLTPPKLQNKRFQTQTYKQCSWKRKHVGTLLMQRCNEGCFPRMAIFLANSTMAMLMLAVPYLMRMMLNANRPTGVPLRRLSLLAAKLLTQRVSWGHSQFIVTPLYMGQLPFLGWHVYGCLIWVLARNTNVIQMRSAYPYANGFLCARKLAQQLSLCKVLTLYVYEKERDNEQAERTCQDTKNHGQTDR